MATVLTRTEHYVSRSDGKIYYYKVGRGEPLVFLHNVDLSGFVWGKVIDKFAEHFTCYSIDLPGHDHSDIPPRQYSVEDYTKAIVDVLDGANVGQTNLLGSHGGAAVSFDLAATHPGRVNKLVVEGLPYWNKERGRILWEKYWLPSFTDTTSYDIPVAPLATWEEAVEKNPNLDRKFWERADAISRRSGRWISLTFQALSRYDAEANAPKIKAPTLLIYGEHDPLRRAEQRVLDGIKGSVLKVVNGTQSQPHWDKPEEFFKLAIDFLQARS